MRQSRQRAFPATARLIGALPPKVTASATLTENTARHLQVTPSRAASPVTPAKKYRSAFTGCTSSNHASKVGSRCSSTPWHFRDSKAPYVALSIEQHHGCVDTVDTTSTLVLRKASEVRVNRRLRRYYLIVRLLPNVFALACLPLSSI